MQQYPNHMKLKSFFYDSTIDVDLKKFNFNNNIHINAEFRNTMFISSNTKKIQYFELHMNQIVGNVENYAILSQNLIEMVSKQMEVIPLYRIIKSGLDLPKNCLEVKIVSKKHMLLIYDTNFFLRYNLVLDEYLYSPLHPILSYSFSDIQRFYKQQFSHQIFYQPITKMFNQVIRNYLSTYIYEFSAQYPQDKVLKLFIYNVEIDDMPIVSIIGDRLVLQNNKETILKSIIGLKMKDDEINNTSLDLFLEKSL